MLGKEKKAETDINKENVAPSRPVAQSVTKAKSPPMKPKELVVRKRESTATGGTVVPKRVAPANSAARRTGPDTTSAARLSNVVRKSIVPSGSGPEGTAGLTKSTARGKEVFGRNKVERTETEKSRKEKEEAAKKARLEAAERGRIASREWAERQKKKLEAQAAAKRKVSATAESDGRVAVPVMVGE